MAINGVKLPMLGPTPPVTTKPHVLSQADPHLLAEVKDLEAKHIIQRVTRHQARTDPGFYCRVFTIPKPGKTNRRFIFDLRSLNRFLLTPKFKMERMSDALALINQGDWLTSVDITEAYHHVPVQQAYRKYLRFAFRNPQGQLQVYQFRSLPMGLSTSPSAYTRVMKAPVAKIRTSGIRLALYMDDMLIVSPSQQQATQDTNQVLQILEDAGFAVNQAKSELQPKQSIRFLGLHIDTRDMTVSVPKEKQQSCTAALKQVKSQLSNSDLTARSLASFIGKIGSLHQAIVDTRLRLVHLQRDKTKAIRSGGWTGQVSLCQQSLEELEFWERNLEELSVRGRKFSIIPPDVTINTDASDLGYGAAITEGRPLQESLEQDLQVQGTWDPDQVEHHINWKELFSILQAVAHFSERFHWENKSILVRSDNTVAISYINKTGGRIPYLNELMIDLHRLCQDRGLRLQATYIKGELNTVADHLSRNIPQEYSKWALATDCMRAINQRFGLRTLDLFASKSNAQADQFVSLHPEQGAMATDAFTLNWGQNDQAILLNPPFVLLPRVLQKVQRDQARGVLIAPLWITAIWWPVMMNMLMDLPLIFEGRHAIVKPESDTNSNKEESGPSWLMGAWPISGDTRETSAYLRKQRDFLQSLTVEQLTQLTTAHGGASPPSSESTRSRFEMLHSSLISRMRW